MTNSEIYNTIAESLQCDIDTNAISYEYASIVNDIAYDKFITESELPENVESILDRYISEAAKDDDGTTEEVTESTSELDSMLEMVNTIEATYESGDITNVEYGALLESVFEKIDAYTESFAGAGGARGKHAENQAKVLGGTLQPIVKAINDYYKREIFGNHLKDEADIAKIKAPTVADLISKGRLPESVVTKNRKAVADLRKFSAAVNYKYLHDYAVDKMVKIVAEDIEGCSNKDKIFKYINGLKDDAKRGMADLMKDLKNVEDDIEGSTYAKTVFKNHTGQGYSPKSDEQRAQDAHDERLAMLKKRNAEKMAKNK